jgi:hypothetical protein
VRAADSFVAQSLKDQLLGLKEGRVFQGVGDLEDEAASPRHIEAEVLIAFTWKG